MVGICSVCRGPAAFQGTGAGCILVASFGAVMSYPRIAFNYNYALHALKYLKLSFMLLTLLYMQEPAFAFPFPTPQ